MISRTEIIAEVLAQTVRSQPFYRRYANTINATAAAVVGALAALVALWQTNGDNTAVVAVLVSIVPILTGVTTRLTKNGVSDSVRARVVSQAHSIDRDEQRAEAASRPAAIPVFTGSTPHEAAGSYITVEGTDFMAVDGPEVAYTAILDTRPGDEATPEGELPEAACDAGEG